MQRFTLLYNWRRNIFANNSCPWDEKVKWSVAFIYRLFKSWDLSKAVCTIHWGRQHSVWHRWTPLQCLLSQLIFRLTDDKHAPCWRRHNNNNNMYTKMENIVFIYRRLMSWDLSWDGDSSVGRAPESWSRGRWFKPDVGWNFFRCILVQST